MKILIAEDEFTTRMMVQVCLEDRGYRVVSVTDGKEAMALLSQPQAPEIAILDWEMPEINGVEVCRQLKEADVENPPYVILLTARDTQNDILRGFDAGADDYMTKPFNENELRARVRVAERMVRTQLSLSQSVNELKSALNQLEMIENRVEICKSCHAVFSPFDGEWHDFKDVMDNGADPRIIVSDCPSCQEK